MRIGQDVSGWQLHVLRNPSGLWRDLCELDQQQFELWGVRERVQWRQNVPGHGLYVPERSIGLWRNVRNHE